MKKFSPAFRCLTFGASLQATPQLPLTLGAAGTFSVLAGSTVTNTGSSTVNGDLGLSPGSAVTGFPPGVVVGGAIHADDSPAVLAQGGLTAAYNDAATRTTSVIIAGDLGGLTLTPGLYQSTSALSITGVLRLDGQGNTNSVFIFQIASALTSFSGSQIILQGGAQEANIFWQVGTSATLGTTSIFNGSILAQASISLGTGAAPNGRALWETGAVTLQSNTIINPGPPSGFVPPPPTPAPPSLILALIGLSGMTLYYSRGKVLRLIQRS